MIENMRWGEREVRMLGCLLEDVVVLMASQRR